MSYPLFILTPGAKQDLTDIAHYTSKKWGTSQALKYATSLDLCFKDIAQGKDISKTVLPDNRAVRVCRCEHHYVFYLKKDEMSVILAVLHERMDLIEQLKERLSCE